VRLDARTGFGFYHVSGGAKDWSGFLRLGCLTMVGGCEPAAINRKDTECSEA
jgi:hypothetical protein